MTNRIYILALAAVICCGTAEAAVMAVHDESVDPVVILAPDTVVNKTAFVLQQQGITISIANCSAYPADHSWNNLGRTYFACLADSTITFSADEPIRGIAVNGWVKKNFSATCDHGTISYLSDDADDSVGEPVLTIADANSSSVTISCANQLRCFSVEIYFSGNPGDTQGEVADTVRFVATVAEAADYSDDPTFSSDGHYSYWLSLKPEETYPTVWLDLYAAVKGDLSGEYSLYNFNVGDYTYVQLSPDELDYEYAYDQEFTIAHSDNGYRVQGWIICENDIRYEFVYDGPIVLAEVPDEEEDEDSAVENIPAGASSTGKFLHQGNILIRANGKHYTLTGTQAE